MAVTVNLGVLLVCGLKVGALLIEVYTKAPDVGKLANIAARWYLYDGTVRLCRSTLFSSRPHLYLLVLLCYMSSYQ